MIAFFYLLYVMYIVVNQFIAKDLFKLKIIFVTFTSLLTK